ALHARADERGCRDLPPARAAVPGLDVPRLPRPRRRGRAAAAPSRAPHRRLGRRMRALARRLLRRARPVRRLLALDIALGLTAAVLVLLQATLLARFVAQAFAGASLRDVSRDLVVLGLAFAGRGVLAWGFELAGRRAASSVLSELRLALVERRLRHQPLALDGVEAGGVAASAAQGVDGLEAYFARYLPQVVLASIVPVVVLAWVAAIDHTP